MSPHADWYHFPEKAGDDARRATVDASAG